MFYILKNGRVKAPLHVLIAQTIHITYKSKDLIQCFNRLGLSISYDQILKSKTNLAAFTIESCMNTVPLPSHFIKSNFTKGEFDNLDHNEDTLSGLNSTHDNVCVLFQDTSNLVLHKPNISDTSVNKIKRSLDSILPCQQLKNFFKPS